MMKWKKIQIGDNTRNLLYLEPVKVSEIVDFLYATEGIVVTVDFMEVLSKK